MGERHGLSTTSAMPAAVRGSSHTAPAPTTRPKIKIIHIIAPEIIKTDVTNFRDLVQRLTGKPVPSATAAVGVATTTTSPPPVVKQEEEKNETTRKRLVAPAAVTTTPPMTAAATEWWSDFAAQQEPTKKRKIKCEVKVEEGGFGDYYDLGRGSNLWMDLSPGGFLSFLEEEADDIFQGLAAADDFLLPALGSSRPLDFGW